MSQERFRNVSETIKAYTVLMYPNPSHSPNDIQQTRYQDTPSDCLPPLQAEEREQAHV